MAKRLRIYVFSTITENPAHGLRFLYESDARAVANLIENHTFRGAVDVKFAAPDTYVLRNGRCYISTVSMELKEAA